MGKTNEKERMQKVDEVMQQELSAPVPQMDAGQARMAAVDRVMQRAESDSREAQIQELNAVAAQNKPIGEQQVRDARALLQEYKRGKLNHDNRMIENERWYNKNVASPPSQKGLKKIYKSSWLLNALNNKHADYMDNFPEVTILPREKSDEKTASMLTAILNVVFERNKFKKTYSRNCWKKINYGTACYGVFWDSSALNGLGDISIKTVNILNLFWAPGIEDIQDSPNLFLVTKEDNEVLTAKYPELKGKIGATAGGETKEFQKEDYQDDAKKSNVYDWYYKRTVNGKTILHYVKFCGDTVLYATENDNQTISDGNGNIIREAVSNTGLYNHGKYPFVLDVLFPMEDVPTGAGWIDWLKDAQEQIDILNNAGLVNVKQCAMKRWAVPNNTKLNMKDFTDWTNPLVRVTDGRIDERTAVELTTAPMSDVVIAFIDRKIDELKETGSNRDFANGSTASGVTSGAAIAALQEAGNKTSRDQIGGTYDAKEEIAEMCIEDIRQFYTVPRCFRITGEDNQTEYINFDNRMMQPQAINDTAGNPIGERLPYFDVKIKAHKKNPFSQVAQNQDIINMYSMGFFDPARADQSLACVELLEIEGKDKLKQKIEQNGTLYKLVQNIQPLLANMAMELDALKGTAYAQQLAQSGLLGNIPAGTPSVAPQAMSAGATSPLGELNKNSGHATVDKAKQCVADATEVK